MSPSDVPSPREAADAVPGAVPDGVTVHHGDCLDVLAGLPDASVDAVVTDPPYGLSNLAPEMVARALAAWFSGDRNNVPDARGFMGRTWDGFVPPPGVWDECLRVLKPGGHLLAFAAPRTQDLMGLSIRLAGFEVRDSITWLMASGFPKSHDVSKAIDKAAGATREVVGVNPGHRPRSAETCSVMEGGAGARGVTGSPFLTAPATTAAAQWAGWGTALKPASEPIVVARKPLAGTVVANVLAHGTGALNIDACRVPGETVHTTRNTALGVMNDDGWQPKPAVFESHVAGRWPANVVLSHAATPDGGDACAEGCVEGCPVAELDAQSGVLTSGANPTRRGSDKARSAYGEFSGQPECVAPRGVDSGGASRFFPVFRYQAKAPARERPKVDGVAHPTVKPLSLMSWLVRLVCPPGGVVLDPFAGSGTTVEACLLEGFRCVAVEREAEYLPLIQARIDRCASVQLPLVPTP